MCFDFVHLAMRQLHELGAEFMEYDDVEGAPPIARDYLYVFASRLRQNMTLPTMLERRRLLRFFRAERLIDRELERSFVFAQPFLQLMVSLQTTPFFYHDTTYTRVQVHPPYMNYCFSGFHLPPHDVSLFSVGMYICTFDSQKGPTPLFHSDFRTLVGDTIEGFLERVEIGVEERLDVLEVHFLLFVIVLLGAVQSSLLSK